MRDSGNGRPRHRSRRFFCENRLRNLRRPPRAGNRAGRHERTDLGHGCRRHRPGHRLDRLRQRRRLEIEERRCQLRTGLRRPHPVDRLDHCRPLQPGNGVGRHRRDLGPEQRLGRRRCLPNHRRRRELGTPRPRGHGAHRQDRRRPHRPRHRLRLRHGPPVERQ